MVESARPWSYPELRPAKGPGDPPPDMRLSTALLGREPLGLLYIVFWAVGAEATSERESTKAASTWISRVLKKSSTCFAVSSC